MKWRYPHLRKYECQDTARIAIKVITNGSHPLKSYFMNIKIHYEYATKPRIETTTYYLRPPWRKNRYEQINQSLCAIPKEIKQHQIPRRKSKETERKIQRMSLRKLLDEEREKVNLFWVPSHMGLPRNKIEDEEAKSALEDELFSKFS
jgi:hypothetical protein